MATNTPNYNMVKPGIDDDALIADLNGNTDIIDAEMRAIRDNIAIVVNGNTAPRAISAGQYLFIKNHSTLSAGGYHATANIANGAAITSSNVAADADGVVNGAFSALNSKIATKSTTATLASGWSVGSNQNIIYKSGDVVSLLLWVNGGTITQSSWNLIATIPSGYRPSSSVDFLGINNTNDKAVHCQITNDGRILVYGSADAGSDLRLSVTFFAG